MVTLANIQGSTLAANVGPQLRGIGDFIVQQRQRREDLSAQEEKSAAIQEQIRILTGQQNPQEIQRDLDEVMPGTDAGAKRNRKQNALLRLNALDPKIGKAALDVIASGNLQERKNFKDNAERSAKNALFISKQTDFASKQRAIVSVAEAASLRGENMERFIELQNLSEPELDLELQRMQIAGQDLGTLLKAPRQGEFTKGTGVIVRLPDGTSARSVPVLNKATGELENIIIPLGGEPVSRIGETGLELTQRRIGEAGGVAGARREVERETAAPIATEKARGRATETRQQGIINRGLDAADTVPILNRSIELLDAVKTGGFDAAALRAKQLFGIESADEAELSSNLGKTVLSQLRSTFGAAFTEREGARLARIEAAFGKSVAGNRRLLTQTKRIAERAADRAIRAAEKSGDTDTADEIRRALDFSLAEPETAVEAITEEVVQSIPEGSIATNPQTGEKLIMRGGVWQTF